LLVHQTCRDQAKYLLFTAGQCFEMSTRSQNRTFPDATVTIALERELNGIEKILIAIRSRPPSWHAPSSGCRRVR
jgi:hypothetical protein